jgi:hypothetical protein
MTRETRDGQAQGRSETGSGPRAPAQRHGGLSPARRRARALTVLALLLATGAYLLLGGGHSARRARGGVPVTAGERPARGPSTKSVPVPAVAPAPPPPHVLVKAPARATGSWRTVAQVHGQPAAWLAQRSGASLMRFDQRLVHLNLHTGSSDGGARGWAYGDRISAREVHLLIAAVNGGFKLTYHDVGFSSGGRVAAPLRAGLASIVTYTDGSTGIGAWRAGVPSARKRVFSVLQNQHLLVDRGVAAASVSGCIIACWGETIGSRTSVARSGIGITAAGQLVWAAGEQLLPADLAGALIAAGAVRALELDINPDWVAGYLYVHRREGPSAVPVVPGQRGLAGQLLEPYSRDFLAFVAN